MKKTKVGDWMTPHPVTIEADATIVEAIHLLKEKNIRRLPVMKHGKLVGIVTERMLLTFSPGKSTSGRGRRSTCRLPTAASIWRGRRTWP